MSSQEHALFRPQEAVNVGRHFQMTGKRELGLQFWESRGSLPGFWNSIILAVIHEVGKWPNLRTEFNKVKKQCALSGGLDFKAFELTLSRLGALLGVRAFYATGVYIRSKLSASGVQRPYNSRQRSAVAAPCGTLTQSVEFGPVFVYSITAIYSPPPSRPPQNDMLHGYFFNRIWF